MRVVVSSFGSAGDFVPALAVGAVLARRGHRVRFVGNPFHEGRVRNAGVDFVAAGERCDLYAAIASEPAYVKTTAFRRLLDEVVAPVGVDICRGVSALLASEGADVVLTADVNFGALWAAQQHGVPAAIACATPVAWSQRRAPIVFGDLPVPRLLAGPLTVLGKRLVGWQLSRILRDLARESDIALDGPSFIEVVRRAPLQLGLWSPALRGLLPGDPAGGRICGFVRGSALGGDEPGVPTVVEEFLATGDPPVVVGLGSIFGLTAGPFLGCLTQACDRLGQRCLVVGHPPDAAFPQNTLAVPYAPYDRVFPHASVVVVHGGAGTTGEALRSGRPVLGVPFAFDQFSLCDSMRRLGVGLRLRTSRHDVTSIAAALRRLLSDRALTGRAAEIGARLSAERDGSEVAADEVERLVAGLAGPTVAGCP